MASRARQVAFIECKTYGHSWDEYNPRNVPMDKGSFDRLTLRCTRCGSTRHDEFDRVGEVVRRNYVNPDGYKSAADEKPSRAALRLMLHGHSTRGVK